VDSVAALRFDARRKEVEIEERSFVAALLWMTANCGWVSRTHFSNLASETSGTTLGSHCGKLTSAGAAGKTLQREMISD
jgi:hypothetical protein